MAFLSILGLAVFLHGNSDHRHQSDSSNSSSSSDPLAKATTSEATSISPTDTLFDDPSLPADAKDVIISAGFECSLPAVKIVKLTPSQYEVQSTQKVATGGFYLLLRLDGVAGRTVQLDFKGSPFDKWGTATPQYTYAADLNHLTGFQSTTQPSTQPREEYRARSRAIDKPALPDTNGQQWHFFSNVWHESGEICLRQKFEQDSAFIALRVPYTPEYNDAYLATLQRNPNVEVIEVGKSKENRPLKIVKIANEVRPLGQQKPCILIYAREHPDEQDCSWIAQGAVDFLASDDAQARAVRERADFVIIPLLDPDGAASATHENIISTFDVDKGTPESLAYAAWFKKWVDEGRRLDLAIALHNPPPGAAFNVACPMMEPEEWRFKQCLQLHAVILDNLRKSGYTVRTDPWGKGSASQRLSGWLSSNYGTLVQPYEVNSLTPRQQLDLAQLREIGKIMACATSLYLSSDQAKMLFAQVDQTRKQRNEWQAKTSPSSEASNNALRAEFTYQLNADQRARVLSR